MKLARRALDELARRALVEPASSRKRVLLSYHECVVSYDETLDVRAIVCAIVAFAEC